MTERRTPAAPPRAAVDEEAARELARIAKSEPLAVDLERMFDELSSGMRREQGPHAFLRSLPTGVRALLVAAVAAALIALSALRFPRPDLAVYSSARLWLSIGPMMALTAVCAALVLRPLQLPSPPEWLTRGAAFLALGGLVVLYALPEANSGHPLSQSPLGLSATAVRALPCLVFGLVTALPFFGLLAAVDRGGCKRAAITAAAAGLLSNLLLELVCPVTATLHLFIGHLGVLVLLFAGAPWFFARSR